MSIALELSGLYKQFVVGTANCHASANVLRGVELSVRSGECVAIIGPPGAGKSTLMLCAAGLVTPSAGELRWFGESSHANAARHAVYYATAADFLRCGTPPEPCIHLVDLPGTQPHAPVDAWIEQRCSRGDAVVLCSRDESAHRRVVVRSFTLSAGRLYANSPARARVAERVRA
jgi:ABC-type cobalamin/Fe3+-siderophores transport system ATPase subunit